jgi:hypothetical protein
MPYSGAKGRAASRTTPWMVFVTVGNLGRGCMGVAVKHIEVGVCGLSCRLCPSFYTEGESRCGGCKSQSRMAVGCPFITCAVKRRGIEFCWDCGESAACQRWQDHREYGKGHDTFVCYAKLEDNIAFIREKGMPAFVREQKKRAELLASMLEGFNEGRSKRYYSIAATVMGVSEVEAALVEALEASATVEIRQRSKILHAVLDRIAEARGYRLALRK